MNYSLKDICTRSCMQIKMFTDYPEKRPAPSEMVFKGEEFQNEVAKSLGDKLFGQEMGFYFKVGEDYIYFSNDLVTTDGDIIEIKSVSPDLPVEDWYFNNSVLQCAIYYAFLKTLPMIKTAKFRTAKTGESKVMELPNEFKYYLRFGDATYNIELIDEEKIKSFIINKFNHTKCWDTARSWDASFKRKEFETLKDAFRYTQIQY